MDIRERNDRAKQRVEASPVLDHVARAGVLTYGVAHLAVAWLVARLAFGDRGGAASGAGALHQLALTTTGRTTLYGVALGFLALVVWQAVEACFGYRRHDRRGRLGLRFLSVVKVLIFIVVLVNALRLASGSSAGGGTDGWTAQVMRLPAGPWIVGATGAVIVVVAFFLARFGWVESFRDTMSPSGAGGSSGRVYVWFGKLGYVSRGVAVALVGSLFGWAAVTRDAQKSGGLDQALNDLLATPLGVPVLLLLAFGLASFGLFCFALARHLDR